MADQIGGRGAKLEAANRARWVTKTERMANELVGRLSGMPKPLLAALAFAVVDEIERRQQQ